MVTTLAEGVGGALLGALIALGALQGFSDGVSWTFVAVVAGAGFLLGALAGGRALQLLADIFGRIVW